MDNRIKFSIIIPCYNSQSYVINAINSVLNQTYSNLELLLINDGSTDNTLSILENYQKNDQRIKVFSKPNGGYATAINYGLDCVTGDYVLMLGSDDVLDLKLLETISIKANQKFPDYITFRAVKYSDGSLIGIDERSSFETFVYESNIGIIEFENKYPKHSRILFARDTAKCFKREIIKDLRYFGRYGYDADGIFSTLYSHRCKSFMCLPYNGYLWTIRENSVSYKTNIEKNIDRINNWNIFFKTINVENWQMTFAEKNYIYYVYTLSKEIATNICINKSGFVVKNIEETMKNIYEILIKNNIFDNKARFNVYFASRYTFFWIIVIKLAYFMKKKY